MTSILSDLIRAHDERARMTTNADQFANSGNPWISNLPNPNETRNVRLAKKSEPKPGFREIRENFQVSPEVVQMRRQREVLKEMLALSGGTRTIAPATSTPEDRERFRIANQGYAKGNSARKAEDHAVYLAQEKADHFAKYAKAFGETMAKAMSH